MNLLQSPIRFQPFGSKRRFGEQLEPRHLLSSISFIAHDVAFDGSGPNATTVADVDGDGDGDLVSSFATDGKIAWLENNGRDGFGTQRDFDVEFLPMNLFSGDMDGDQDVDLVSFIAGPEGSRVSWYENIDAHGAFSKERLIGFDVDSEPWLGDFDGDEDLDFAVISREFISWFENVDGHANFDQRKRISIEAPDDKTQPHIISLADLDNDGDQDLLSGGRGWFENTNGKGHLADLTKIIDGEFDFTDRWSAVDMDGDEDLDVLGEYLWYENIDGAESWKLREFELDDDGLFDHAAMPADVDGDGDMDLISIEEELVWYENVDAEASFWPRSIVAPFDRFSQHLSVSDLDRDGDIDFFFSFFHRNELIWYEARFAGDANNDGAVGFVDFLALSAHFGETDAVWADGDFDADGEVTFADFLILSANFSS